MCMCINDKLKRTHKLTCAHRPASTSLKNEQSHTKTHTHTTATCICREFFFFFCNAWLNCCKATENFIIQSRAKRRAGERREAEKRGDGEWVRAGRQAATVAAAGWGEAGRREPEREGEGEQGRRRRRGGGKGQGGRAGDRERERERGKLEPSGRAAASASTGAAAAIQRAPFFQPVWLIVNGLQFMGPLDREPQTHTHTHTHTHTITH